MTNAQELANLITIRTFLVNADEVISCKMSQVDSRAVRTKLEELDRTIIELALKLDLKNDVMFVEKSKPTSKTYTTNIDVDLLMAAVDNTRVEPRAIPIPTDDDGDEVAMPEAPETKSSKSKHKIVKHG